jgi:cleavage stimulation factor subunit 1
MASLTGSSRYLYQLITRQLEDDGFHSVAAQLAHSALVQSDPSLPQFHLADLVDLGMKSEDKVDSMFVRPMPDVACAEPTATSESTASLPQLETHYLITHKGAVRTACISPDGSLMATGSADKSIKLIDVDLIHSMYKHRSTGLDISGRPLQRPVLKTYYEHQQGVTSIDFHVLEPIFIATSEDGFVRIFDCDRRKISSKRRLMHRVELCGTEAWCVRFHPSGEYFLVATQNPFPVLYDLKTLQSFLAVRPPESMLKDDAVTRGKTKTLAYAPGADQFATGHSDGGVRVWDGISGDLVFNITGAQRHGAEISQVNFARHHPWVLSSGRDGCLRLWDLRTGGELHCMNSRTSLASVMMHDCPSEFSFNDEFIFGSDEQGSSAVVWSSMNGELLGTFSGHNGMINHIASSPAEMAFFTCSSDSRGRFWAEASL